MAVSAQKPQMARPAPRQDVSPVYFSEDFYRELLHEVDPEQDITPGALRYLNKVADNFLRDLMEWVRLVKKADREGDHVVQDTDVFYVLQSLYGVSLPGPTGPLVSDQRLQKPTDDYEEKRRAVQAFAANHQDD